MTSSTNCLICGGKGMRVAHQQGDPVPGLCNQYSQTTYASTLYVSCECVIIRSEVIEGTPIDPADGL